MTAESKIDEASVWLAVRELAADALDRLDSLHGVECVRLVHDLARHARLEISILESRDAIAICEVLAVFEQALAKVLA